MVKRKATKGNSRFWRKAEETRVRKRQPALLAELVEFAESPLPAEMPSSLFGTPVYRMLLELMMSTGPWIMFGGRLDEPGDLQLLGISCRAAKLVPRRARNTPSAASQRTGGDEVPVPEYPHRTCDSVRASTNPPRRGGSPCPGGF